MEFSSGLMDPVTGAFHHYQTRLNDETRRGPATLLGQAIGLRACTLGYGRTSLAPVLGDAIIEYVEQTLTNHHGLLNLDALGPHAFAQWRLHHYYWYLVAAHEYCVLRERDGLADALAATANGILIGPQTPCVSGQIIATPGYLDEAVALAALAEYFLPDLAIANKSTVVARFINALNAFRIADGGYSNEPITARQRDAIVDIDLTIEIVRLATRFAMGDNPDRWRAIQHHGLRALSQPAVALARPIEAGILLIDEELRESTGPCGAVAHQQQTFEVPPKSLKQLRFHPPQ